MSEYIITTEQINWFCDHMDEYEPIPAKIAHLKPIVRCRDCKHRFGNSVCAWKNDPDGFCDWGIKKEVGAHFWRCECGAENYGFETCQYCGRSERC